MLDNNLKCHVRLRVLQLVTYILGISQAWILVFRHLLAAGTQTLMFSGAMKVCPAVTPFLMKTFCRFTTGRTKKK
jgi:hypothetical protein